MRPRGSTVLITGASTGLGMALARRLLRVSDHRLVLTARAESLPRFAQAGIVDDERVAVRGLDVTHGAERRRVVEECADRWGGVDVLINNAGVAYRSVLEHVTEAEFHDQMEVNYVGPVELARLVLPSMRRKQAGRIINVSSVGGMMAMPTMAIYSASKFALEGATESLYYEVKPWRIKVSLIQPGFVHSSSFENVRLTAESAHSIDDLDEAYHRHYEHMTPFIARLMKLARATPETIARRIERTMHRRWPPLRVPVTFDAAVFGWLRRWMPRPIYHWLLYRSLPGVRQWGLPPPRSVEHDRLVGVDQDPVLEVPADRRAEHHLL
jgi:NAD(P)-dependent dehydrogenase (short-subunit alcohol dehydrogenase family)